MPDTNVFISYSTHDRRWLERLQVHLAPLRRDFDVEIWADTRITAGARWREELETAVDKANVAVLIVSADYLASEFIRDNELPPLLKSAELRGALILPVIASPSLFGQIDSLAQFQSVNPPDTPLLGMSECEQERTCLNVAERILERHQGLVPTSNAGPPPAPPDVRPRGEDFLAMSAWTRLVKIGNWFLDSAHRQIIGASPHSYLLSREEYGLKPFQIRASLSFSRFLPHVSQPVNKMNAGIVLGWNGDKQNPRYVNILISGVDLMVERIGFNGGTVVRDYEHATEAIPLRIEENTQYDFEVDAHPDRIEVRLSGKSVLRLDGLVGLPGRVGLRPWRSQLACTAFEVAEVLG